MTTIINNPGSGETGREVRGDGSSVALILLLLLIIVAGILFYVYGLPRQQDSGGLNVTVPESVDVNVRTPDLNTGAGGEGTGGVDAQGGE